MKHSIIFILAVFLLISSCSDSENPVDSNNDALIEEAVDFSLKVVDCYFTQDTTTFRKYLPELLYMVDPAKSPYETSYFILSHFLSSYDYSEYNLELYKNTYDYEIWEYEKYARDSENWLEQLIYWHPNENDYLFIGYQNKDDKTPFMDYKPLVFFVTKSSGEWKLRAIQ